MDALGALTPMRWVCSLSPDSYSNKAGTSNASRRSHCHSLERVEESFRALEYFAQT